jgi:XTP/dITP diphosphohydrolase
VRLDQGMSIAIASRNAGKVRELIGLWGSEPPALIAHGGEYADVEETGSTYEANALLKARALALARGGPALADDSGIEVEALGWGPGVLSARTPAPDTSWEERNAHIIRACDAFGDLARRARFVCVCVLLVPGFAPLVARGEVEGSIARVPTGDSGFGYDPIFVYSPYGMTFAQAGDTRKQLVSHRGRAVRALRTMLELATALDPK